MSAARFITTDDFLNEPLKISQNEHTLASLQGFIDKYEYDYLKKILGNRIYTEFIADLDGNNVPQHPKFTALLNGDTYTDINGDVQIYDGLKEPIRYFIWAKFVSKSNYINTIAGTVSHQNENSNVLTAAEIAKLCRTAWNTGVPIARDANYFITRFESYEATATGIALDNANTYIVTITDTKYLKNGDTVTINGTDYEIANLVENTSFTIESATDITAGATIVDWEIFGTYETKPLEYSFLNK